MTLPTVRWIDILIGKAYEDTRCPSLFEAHRLWAISKMLTLQNCREILSNESDKLRKEQHCQPTTDQTNQPAHNYIGNIMQ